jgi:hypothetical protein
MRLKMGQILFYRVLEKVLEAEKKKGKSIGALLDQTPFHQVRETGFFYNNRIGNVFIFVEKFCEFSWFPVGTVQVFYIYTYTVL